MREYIVPVDATYRDYEEMFIGFIRTKKELVRCKDCKHWKLERYVGGEGMACQLMPSDGNVNLTNPTDYCCWAERKEE